MAGFDRMWINVRTEQQQPEPAESGAFGTAKSALRKQQRNAHAEILPQQAVETQRSKAELSRRSRQTKFAGAGKFFN